MENTDLETEILGKFWKRFNPHVLIILTSPLLARKALPQGGTWVWLNLATPQSLAWLVAYIFANFGLENLKDFRTSCSQRFLTTELLYTA